MKKLFIILSTLLVSIGAYSQIGVGTKAPKNAKILFDGTEKMLNENWKYWEGPRLKASMPIKWKIEADPAGNGTVVNTNDPAAAGGLYGAADIVSKEEFKDFRLHVEFFIKEKGGIMSVNKSWTPSVIIY